MSRDLLGRRRWRLPASRDLLGGVVTQLSFDLDSPEDGPLPSAATTPPAGSAAASQARAARFTAEQAFAIDHREGDLVLDAGAGSGKTTVLVERFARGVLDDGVQVGRILAITFTEKAAAELRDRIRRRLRELGDEEAARAADGAWISTIHGFCARVVREHALAAGIDPEFAVLDPIEAARLRTGMFDRALAELARTPAGSDLIATYPPVRLRPAIIGIHAELRSRGDMHPTLPSLPEIEGRADERCAAVRAAAAALLRELGAIEAPGKRVEDAITMLQGVDTTLGEGVPWPGDLIALKLSNGASALRTDACEQFRDSVGKLQAIAEIVHSKSTRDALDELLRAYGAGYAQAKAVRARVDFEDLELYARGLLRRPELSARYRDRFERVMVDEMQDTNRVQLELIDLVTNGNLFMVGDAQQSIYGFRHADVALFMERGRLAEEAHRRRSLQTNFRSRADLLAVINAAFAAELGEAFRELHPGRTDPSASEALVELLIVDRHGDFEDTGVVAPWRAAEARLLARRVRSLLDDGEFNARDVVVLTRATADLGAYERALEDVGVPTYVVGGRGYWAHPQVVELVALLRALLNPLDLEAWFTVLNSHICGLSLDGLVLVRAGAIDELDDADRHRYDEFVDWFAAERRAAARLAPEVLIDRALRRRETDVWLAGFPDARRRLANVHKLMRLAREWEAEHGGDLAGFVELLEARVGGEGGHENEAPVAGEGLDAVRLMTIHRSKGLEFPVVCVADLGRLSGGRGYAPLIRISRDGQRFGLRLGRPGTTADIDALAYTELKEEQRHLEAAEERRLFYVAMTRARERLILSGAAHLVDWTAKNRQAPIGWLAPALVPEIGARVSEGEFTDRGVRVTVVDDESQQAPAARPEPVSTPSSGGAVAGAGSESPSTSEVVTIRPVPSARSLSYTAITAYHRCGYRFYVERELGLPRTDDAGHGAALRGTRVHDLLRGLDFARAPELPPEIGPELVTQVVAVAGSSTAKRLAASPEVGREQSFAFRFDDALITGVFDVLATEHDRSGRRTSLIVDYKTDRLTTDPETMVATRYATQQRLYGLAALVGGSDEVEVVHLFTAAPEQPVSARFTAASIPELEADLGASLAGLLAGEFPVTTTPGPERCAGCPAAGGLCSHPLEVTGR